MDKQLASTEQFLRDLQQRICQQLAALDGGEFVADHWQRAAGGGGCSCLLSDGEVFEQAGVNFSHVYGDAMPASASAQRPALAGARFRAMGVSLVVHPRNPYVPTSHANVRLFVAEKPDSEPVWWFGGGFDLTPFYGFAEDCRHWHQTARDLCLSFADDLYLRYKQWCDRYFYLQHRQEPRGIGGLFFDDLNTPDFATCLRFIQAVGQGYLDGYLPIVQRRKATPYHQHQRDFQLWRRGRYVEFNLLWDRGTLFGLQSGGRTESILMSMPPLASWHYQPPADYAADQAKLLELLAVDDWLTPGVQGIARDR